MDARKIWEIDRNWPGKHVPTGGEVHPDLVRFRDHWYCGFKETGRARLIRSGDGKKWETARLFEWDGAFVGRPYLSVSPEGRLMVHTWIRPLQSRDCVPGKRTERAYAHGQDEPLVALVKRFYVTWLSPDGANWSAACAHEADLGFSVTWHNGVCYGVGGRGTLFYSCDGLAWRALADNIFPDREAALSFDPHDFASEPGTRRVSCNETALYFDPGDDSALALTRTNPVCVILGAARGPNYRDWTWRDIRVDWETDGTLRPAHEVMGVQLGCPVLRRLADGRLFGVGRADASDETGHRSRVVLFLLDPRAAVLRVFAKLDGYGGYAGVVEHEGRLWVACSNNTKGKGYEVFLIRTPLPAGNMA